MIQLYFLSILCNGLAGFLLFREKEDAAVPEGGISNEKLKFSAGNPTFHLVLGILSAVTGVLKLLSPAKFPVIGDLLPAAAGVMAGLMLIFGIYRQDVSSVPDTPGSLDLLGTSLLRFRKSIGLALLGIAILHFLFPEALFL